VRDHPANPAMRSRRRYPGRHAGPGLTQASKARRPTAQSPTISPWSRRGSGAGRGPRQDPDELRDGLLEAVEAYQARGRALQEAIAAAIAEFGDPHIVAEAFGPELAAVQAGRVALGLLATGPLVGSLVWPPVVVAAGASLTRVALARRAAGRCLATRASLS
jgi:hypothetical protein